MNTAAEERALILAMRAYYDIDDDGEEETAFLAVVAARAALTDAWGREVAMSPGIVCTEIERRYLDACAAYERDSFTSTTARALADAERELRATYVKALGTSEQP